MTDSTLIIDALQAVDLEVIRMRTDMYSENTSQTTETRESFNTELLERDVSCVWTGAEAGYGSGFHIIPFRRGSEVCVQRLLCSPGDSI